MKIFLASSGVPMGSQGGGGTIKTQIFHPVPPKNTKISATIMKFQGASSGKRSGDPGPKIKKAILNLFWPPGALPNRCALKFHDGGTYFRTFWWHGMNTLIFDVNVSL